MRSSMTVALLVLGLAGLAQAQWSVAGAMGSAVASDPVASAVSKMLETLVQPKAGVLNTFQQTAATAQQAMQTQFAAVKGQAEAALAAYEAQYCTPAVLKKSVKKPAQFVGHGMAITFSTGNCTFNETKWLVDGVKELDCTEPSISYVKTPANFTSHYHKAAAFQGKECKMVKTFGEATERVLFVFDSSAPLPSTTDLAATLTSEIKQLLSGMTNAAGNAVQGVAGLFKS